MAMSSVIRHPPDIDRIARQALVLSVLCHLLVFHFIIITFKPQPVAARPSFVFLGSFLDLHNFLNLPTRSDVSGEMAIKIRMIPASRAFHALEESRAGKPEFRAAIEKTSKRYLKNDFMPTHKQIPIRARQLRKWGINPNFPQYVPMRLQVPFP